MKKRLALTLALTTLALTMTAQNITGLWRTDIDNGNYKFLNIKGDGTCMITDMYGAHEDVGDYYVSYMIRSDYPARWRRSGDRVTFTVNWSKVTWRFVDFDTDAEGQAAVSIKNKFKSMMDKGIAQQRRKGSSTEHWEIDNIEPDYSLAVWLNGAYVYFVRASGYDDLNM